MTHDRGFLGGQPFFYLRLENHFAFLQITTLHLMRLELFEILFGLYIQSYLRQSPSFLRQELITLFLNRMMIRRRVSRPITRPWIIELTDSSHCL